MNWKKSIIWTLVVVGILLILSILQDGKSPYSEIEPIVKSGEPKALYGVYLTQKGELSKTSDATLKDAFNKAKNGGFNLAIWTSDWGSNEPSLGEYDWGLMDYLVEHTSKNNFKFSLSLELAQIEDNYNFPKEIMFTNFDDPYFIERFKIFTKELVTRYKGKIDYLWIGQEVELYLYNHPEQKEPIINLFREFEKEVKLIDPNIKVGFVGGYHLAKEIGAIDILQELSNEGDLIAFTYHHETSPFTKDPSNTIELFEEMISYFPNTKIAIHETEWSSNGPKGSPEKQSEYIIEISNVIDKHKDKFEFFSWYVLHDFSKKDNMAANLEYGISEENKAFLDWHGSVGLFNNDGTEKPAWQTWKDYMLIH